MLYGYRPRSEDNGGRQERSNEHDRGDKTKDPSVAGREKRDDDRRSDRGQSDHSRNADHSDRRHDSQRPLDKKVTKDARSHHDRDAQSNQSSNKQNNDNRSSDYSYGMLHCRPNQSVLFDWTSTFFMLTVSPLFGSL